MIFFVAPSERDLSEKTSIVETVTGRKSSMSSGSYFNASDAAAPVPEEQIGPAVYRDEFGNEISEEEALTCRLVDKNGNVVCEFIQRREGFVSLRYTPQDGTILPITVCTQSDLEQARQTANLRHMIFGAVYCVEVLAAVLVYFIKRAR